MREPISCSSAKRTTTPTITASSSSCSRRSSARGGGRQWRWSSSTASTRRRSTGRAPSGRAMPDTLPTRRSSTGAAGTGRSTSRSSRSRSRTTCRSSPRTCRAATLPRSSSAATTRSAQTPPAASACCSRPTPRRLQAIEAAVREGHCGKLPESVVPRMAAAQRARDAVIADALIARAPAGAVLIAGNGHVRRDLGVPVQLAVRAPQRSALAVGIVEVIENATRAEDYVAPAAGDAPRFDFAVFTPRTARPDPCAGFAPRGGAAAQHAHDDGIDVKQSAPAAPGGPDPLAGSGRRRAIIAVQSTPCSGRTVYAAVRTPMNLVRLLGVGVFVAAAIAAPAVPRRDRDPVLARHGRGARRPAEDDRRAVQRRTEGLRRRPGLQGQLRRDARRGPRRVARRQGTARAPGLRGRHGEHDVGAAHREAAPPADARGRRTVRPEDVRAGGRELLFRREGRPAVAAVQHLDAGPVREPHRAEGIRRQARTPS